MTIEKFLSFWSQHNIEIIESMIALVIIFSLFLAYRSFFSKASKGESKEGVGHSLDTTQIEKALQKILDNQNQSPASVGKSSPSSHTSQSAGDADDLGVDLDAMDIESGGGVAAEEVQQLRVAITESQKKIETLQAQLNEAVQKASELAESAAAPSVDAGITSKDAEEFKAKIHDLEARLSEYEIISEDIADLSRYRDENEQLRKDIEALKASGVAAGSVAPTMDAPVPIVTSSTDSSPLSSEISSEMQTTSAVETESEVEPVGPAESELDAMLAEAINPPPATEAANEASSADLIDDELMKEFAAAVEGQKTLSKAAGKSGDGSKPAAQTGADTDQLMDEFENFVSKKS